MQPLTIHIENKTYLVPTCWELVSLESYITFNLAETEEERFKCISGIEQAEQLDDYTKLIVYNALEFCHSEPEIEPVKEVDVNKHCYAKYISSMFRIGKHEKEYILKVLPFLIAAYTRTYWKGYSPEEAERIAYIISNEPFVEHYATGMFILNELIKITDEHSKSLYSIPDRPESTEAGIDLLRNEVGMGLSVHALAGGDYLKHEQVEQMPLEDALGCLYMANKEAAYQDRLQKVLERKSKNSK